MIRGNKNSPEGLENVPLHSNAVRVYKGIPNQFANSNIKLLKVRAHGKEAVERGWQSVANYTSDSPSILDWIKYGGNYGVTSPAGFYASVDADTKKIQDALEGKLPRTFRWSTGKPGHFQYGYFILDGPIGCVPLKDGAYIKGKGGYALGPGSIHPNGIVYGSREIRDIPIAIVKKEDLLNSVKDFMITDSGEIKGRFESLPAGTARIDRDEIVRILTPYWSKADGRRNDLTLAIAGFIARSGGDEQDAVFIISELARLTGKGKDHISGARYSFHKDGKIRGFSTLKKLMEEISDDN